MSDFDVKQNLRYISPDLLPLVDKMETGTATASEVATLRQGLVATGIPEFWTELARSFPAYFADGYAPAPPFQAPPPLVHEQTTVPFSQIEKLVGKTMFARMVRKDGETCVVAGKLHFTEQQGEYVTLRFSPLDPALALRMAAATDRPWAPMHYDMRIGPGLELASVTMAAEVSSDMRLGATSPKPNRVDVSRTAEAVIDGTFTPKVDLQPLKDVVDGTIAADALKQKYLDDLKIERNALAAALIQPLLGKMVAFLETERAPENPYSSSRLGDVQKWMLDRCEEETTTVLSEAAGKPDSPLGKAYARLAKVLELESQAVPHPVIGAARQDPLGMIKVAANTPLSIPFAIVRALGSVLGEKPTGAQVEQHLNEMSPSMLRLASSDMEVFLVMLGELMGSNPGPNNPFKTESLELGAKGLTFSGEKLKDIEAHKGIRLDTKLGATTGCPARLTVKGQNQLPKILELVAKQAGEAVDFDRAKGR